MLARRAVTERFSPLQRHPLPTRWTPAGCRPLRFFQCWEVETSVTSVTFILLSLKLSWKFILKSNSVCDVWTCLSILMHLLQKDATCWCCLRCFIAERGNLERDLLVDQCCAAWRSLVHEDFPNCLILSIFYKYIVYSPFGVYSKCYSYQYFWAILHQVITSAGRSFLIKATLWEPSRPKHFSPKTERLGNLAAAIQCVPIPFHVLIPWVSCGIGGLQNPWSPPTSRQSFELVQYGQGLFKISPQLKKTSFSPTAQSAGLLQC